MVSGNFEPNFQQMRNRFYFKLDDKGKEQKFCSLYNPNAYKIILFLRIFLQKKPRQKIDEALKLTQFDFLRILVNQESFENCIGK